MEKGKKINWLSIVIFYVIACAVSWPFYAWRDIYSESWVNSSIPGAIRNLGVMWGPGIAAIICFFVFKKSHNKTISLSGTSPLNSILFFLIPYAIWFSINIINPSGSNFEYTHFLVLIPFGFLMILGEELGWRGFLQDALNNLKEWKRWLILGTLWEFWHFTNMMMNKEPIDMIKVKLIRLIAVIIITVVIGKLTNRTKSLLVAITLHSWINIQIEYNTLNTIIAGILSLIFWTYMIMKWKPL